MSGAATSHDNVGIFRHREDRWPVFIILLLTTLDFSLYFTVENASALIIYYLIMILPKGTICAWNHHHQHIFTFRNTALNRLMEQAYALHTGVTSHLWRLHHVLGHHLNFLDQQKDESRWKRKDGTPMGAIEYSFNVALSAYSRGYTVGKKYPKQQKIFLTFTAITVIFVTALVWYKPIPGLLLFVLPMVTSLLFTAYVTYGHHSGLDTQEEFEASHNNLSPLYNFFTGNLGYHTAHHHKQGVHWSKLPELHKTISPLIPQRLYKASFITRVLLRD